MQLNNKEKLSGTSMLWVLMEKNEIPSISRILATSKAAAPSIASILTVPSFLASTLLNIMITPQIADSIIEFIIYVRFRYGCLEIILDIIVSTVDSVSSSIGLGYTPITRISTTST